MSSNLLISLGIAGLVVVGGIIAGASPAVARQLDRLHVTPQPQRLSELYFADYTKLPTTVAAGSQQKIPVTIVNREHRPTNYHYEIILEMRDRSAVTLAQGDLTLTHEQSRTIHPEIAMPTSGGRGKITITLTYQAISPGAQSPSPQTQSINYWVVVNRGESS